MFAIPVSTVIGSPISGFILGLEGVAGLHGWQWMYIIEAVPALLMAFVVFFYLTDRPADAKWLDTDERSWLQSRLDAERTNRESIVRGCRWGNRSEVRAWFCWVASIWRSTFRNTG